MRIRKKERRGDERKKRRRGEEMTRREWEREELMRGVKKTEKKMKDRTAGYRGQENKQVSTDR